ncbi:MAG: hypothetical protein KIT25_14580 [Enhydrobacter sp.]|nr:MAG: hypothetical protein KIT25_14580 [Enhydrobacter sp.]
MRMVERFPAAVLAVAATVAAASAWAQSPQITDSRTGKIWTPELVDTNPDGTQKSWADRAFDPASQTASVPGEVVQRPRANLMGTVPITAGPTVPIVTIDTPSLQAIPGSHWLAVLYVTNNSGQTVNTVVGCQFTNQGRKVEDVRIIVPPAGPGERLGVPVRGPRTDLFVDRVGCQVL